MGESVARTMGLQVPVDGVANQREVAQKVEGFVPHRFVRSAETFGISYTIFA